MMWLPDLDSNQDKLNQNQLCYHYTIRQLFNCGVWKGGCLTWTRTKTN